MELLFATSNQHKLNEIRQILPSGYSVKGLAELGFLSEIPETGTTIRENALLKARFLGSQSGIGSNVVIADDSGLEVMALGGEPGVYSARFAGEPKSDEKNNLKLLEKMANVTNRKARFVTVIALITPGEEYVFEGEVRGTIAHAPRGSLGFGYDPLFIPRGYRSTFAELGPEIKNTISHRAEAVRKLLLFLRQMPGLP